MVTLFALSHETTGQRLGLMAIYPLDLEQLAW